MPSTKELINQLKWAEKINKIETNQTRQVDQMKK